MRSPRSSATAPGGGSTVSELELRGALESALAGAGVALPSDIRRRPSEYRTSFPLEELDLTLEDGSELRLIFKQLAWSSLGEEARLAKPEFLHDPLREPAVYASVLAPRNLGPDYYGSAIDANVDRYWLFAERVDGRELYQVGDLELWQAVARWLAKMHSSLASDLEQLAESGRLVTYDEPYYRRWIARAGEFATESGQWQSRTNAIASIADRYDAVVEGLLELPRTVIHGELYASNVLLAGEPPALRVCPVDWELAAAAPGLIDLAALISGGWSEDEREAIVSAYRSVAGTVAFSADQLDLARLHLAIQWLGWAPPRWIPPVGQRHDWLGEALTLAEGLDL